MTSDHRIHRMLIVVLPVVAVAIAGARASVDPIAPFVGVFQGQSVFDAAGILTPRDIDTEIRATPDGFVMDWHSAVIEQGRAERQNHEVVFERVGSSDVYRAHQPLDMYGNARAPDLIEGRDYAWARLDDHALVVHVLRIVSDGSVDLRIYRREVEGDRMRLQFTRLRDGRPLRSVRGVLQRKAD